jgi:hypothetical protein
MKIPLKIRERDVYKNRLRFRIPPFFGALMSFFCSRVYLNLYAASKLAATMNITIACKFSRNFYAFDKSRFPVKMCYTFATAEDSETFHKCKFYFVFFSESPFFKDGK